MSEQTLLTVLVTLALMLLVGRGTAELARRVGQPEVLGELLGGFLLGPSVFGWLAPQWEHMLFAPPAVQGALQTVSWIGALLLLLIAGMEADLRILAQKAKPGLFAAGLVIVASLIAGSLFAWLQLGLVPPNGVYLGIVLSVTAVSVAAKLLMETEQLRRDYAQVILAAGIASEVVVWLLVSIAAALRGNPWLAGIRTLFFAFAFFAIMLTVGKRFTFWAMRRTSDLAFLANGQLTLVLVLTFISAAMTQAIGLHALLGAFVFGVLLSQSPRVTIALKEHVQTLTISLFAPVFFVLAGMRVNIFDLGNMSAVMAVFALFLVATAVKIALGTLGARLGGLRGTEAALVGLGTNLKGGTDVIVAIIGTEMGLMSQTMYTMYAVVAILTVLASPPVMLYLQARVPPNEEEQQRLEREEAKRRAYLAEVERVLAPILPPLLPFLPATILQNIARTKQQEQEVFDITQLSLEEDKPPQTSQEETLHTEPQPMEANAEPEIAKADAEMAISEADAEVSKATQKLTEADELDTVEVTNRKVPAKEDPIDEVKRAAEGFKVVAIGARRPKPGPVLSFGKLQDEIINQLSSDIMVVVQDHGKLEAEIKRILVPINGLEYSLAAADVAAYIAKARDAEITLFNVMHWEIDSLFWREAAHPERLDAGYSILHEARFRIERLGVKTFERVRVSDDPAMSVLNELDRRKYDLLVMGSMEKKSPNGVLLGKHTQTILTRTRVPVVLLVSHAVAAA